MSVATTCGGRSTSDTTGPAREPNAAWQGGDHRTRTGALAEVVRWRRHLADPGASPWVNGGVRRTWDRGWMSSAYGLLPRRVHRCPRFGWTAPLPYGRTITSSTTNITRTPASTAPTMATALQSTRPRSRTPEGPFRSRSSIRARASAFGSPRSAGRRVDRGGPGLRLGVAWNTLSLYSDTATVRPTRWAARGAWAGHHRPTLRARAWSPRTAARGPAGPRP